MDQTDDSRREQLTYDDDGYERQQQLAYEQQYSQATPGSAGANRQRDLAGDGYGPAVVDGHPPEQPRGTYSDVPPPEPSPFEDENDRSHAGLRDSSANYASQGATRPVLGLDEPILFPSVQPLVMPTATAQLAPPELLGLTSQLVPPGSQQNALGSSHRVIPTYGVSATAAYPQPSSVQLAPGSGGVPYFTQLAGSGH